jgi:hypothetical protein
MGLRSREWFFNCCYKEVKKSGKLAYLANKALELGFGKENTQGHILQACGAVQKFFQEYPQHKTAISIASPVDPYEPKSQMLKDWLTFFNSKTGPYGRRRFGYNWDYLRTYLTRKYGGQTVGGGGGDNEFEIVLRLMADFL